MTTLTKYQTYPKYKPSGIDWLGDIPEGWETKRLRHFFDYHAGGVWGEEEKGDQNDLICLRVADFDFDHLGLSENDLTVRNIPENQHTRILEKGDILLEKSGGGEKQTVGRAVRFDSNVRSVCSNFIEKLTPLKTHNSKYISYLMSALYFGAINVRSIKQTTGIQNLDLYSYFCEVVPFPKSEIQQSIADFLDRETKKIDEVVKKKQKLIELLLEKRQAIISQAVTKGLNPKAKMKDSGISWLGEIPEKWEVMRLRFLIQGAFKYGANEEAVDNNRDNPRYIRITDIKDDGDLNDETFKSLPVKIADQYLLDDGDILFARSGATVGRTFRYKKSWGKCCYAGYLIKMTPSKMKILSEFLYYFTRSNSYIEWKDSIFWQATIQNISAEKYKNFIVCFPKLKEQQVIVDFLDHEIAKINEVVKKVEIQIAKLTEFRQALISNVVTGKIKVI